MLKEIFKIAGQVILAFGGLALFVAGIALVLTFFIDDGQPLWHPIVGSVIVLAFSVFWVYMRTHAWS